MSCQMSDSCESELEPVTRMKDVGRPKPTKRPTSGHVVNPNFMFFCQIVLLVIPISVLFAGLYFMNISSPVVVLTCGAIIFAVLCIFLFIRPFKVEEKCKEIKPLRRSYEYSPIKHAIDVKNELPKSNLTKPDKRHSIYHGLNDVDDGVEDDEECPPLVKHESTDTLLSLKSSLPDVASQKRITTAECSKSAVTSAGGRCRCCLMGCRGPITRENEVGFQDYLRPPKSMQDSAGSTLGSTGCSIEVEQMLPPTCLAVIEEEGTTMTPLGSPGPCSERNNSAKRLIPDVALSDTTSASNPTSNRNRNFSNTPYSDNTCHFNLSQPSRAMPDYSSAPASSALTRTIKTELPPKSPRKTTSPRRTEQKIEKSVNRDQLKYGRGQSIALTSNNRLGPLEFRNNYDIDASHPSSSIPATFSTILNTEPHNRGTPDSVCTDKVCSLEVRNQLQPQVATKKPPSVLLRNNYFKGPLETTPEKPMTSKRRGYLDQNNHELIAHGKQDIFMDDSKKGHLEKRTVVPEFQAVKFQLCPSDPCSSSNRNRNKQPILIKLFPTSSKDGVFSWEANPVEPKHIVNTHLRTANEYVQTTAPEMVDTQTSGMFPSKGLHFNVPEVKDADATQVKVAHQSRIPGKAAHQASSGSIVDFVLRPFSKVVNPVVKTTGDKTSEKDVIMNSKKRSKCGKNEWQKPQEINKTNSSKFDILKIQSLNKNRNHGIEVKELEKITKADSVNKVEKSPQKGINAKIDICSIYYSSIHSKLYQPTKSGLLVTESSKEEVDKPQRAVEMPKIVNAGTDKVPDKSGTHINHHKKDKYNLESNQKLVTGQGTKRDTTEIGRRLSRTKRKSGDEKNMTKFAKHDRPDPKYSKNLFYNNSFLPRGTGTEDIEISQTQANSELKDQLTFMFPPLNLDFSSGPCDEESVLKFSQEPKKSLYKNQPTDCTDSKKSRSPNLLCGSKSKNYRTSHQVETKLFRKSSSSYENVVIEKVIKQKRRTLKKFK